MGLCGSGRRRGQLHRRCRKRAKPDLGLPLERRRRVRASFAALQRLMGHSKMETTQIYLRRLDRERAIERVRDLSWGFPFTSTAVEARTGFEPVNPSMPRGWRPIARSDQRLGLGGRGSKAPRLKPSRSAREGRGHPRNPPHSRASAREKSFARRLLESVCRPRRAAGRHV